MDYFGYAFLVITSIVVYAHGIFGLGVVDIPVRVVASETTCRIPRKLGIPTLRMQAHTSAVVRQSDSRQDPAIHCEKATPCLLWICKSPVVVRTF